jgi:WD40 repeat protein
VVSAGTSIHIRDLEHGEPESTYRIGDSALGSMGISQGATRLLLVTGGDVLEWSLDTEEQLHCFATELASLTSVAYWPDETRVVTAGQTPTTLKEFDLSTEQQRISIKSQFDAFHAAVYRPEGSTAFVVGGFAPPRHNLVRYDLQTGEKLHQCLPN